MALAGSSNPVVSVLSASDVAIADAGAYYTSINPTPGLTGIIGPVSTTFDETKGLLTVYNGGQLNIYPRFLRLRVTVIGTTGTTVEFTQCVDNGNRYSSGGTALTTNCTNMASANASGAVVTFGALSTTAASSQRRILHDTAYKIVTIETANDTYQFSWGGATQLEDPASLSNVAAALSNVSYSFAPIVIGPGQTFSIHQWRASITVGITFQPEFAYIAK